MKYSLLPELTEAKKAEVSAWITATLAAPGLVQSTVAYSWSGEFAIYRNGRVTSLHRNGAWQLDSGGSLLYIGYREPNGNHPLPLLERLAVMGAVISLTETWETHYEQFTAVASAALIDAYTGVMSGMVQTEAAVCALAFNADRSVMAARIGDCYHLPNGELVEVDETWTVVSDRPTLRIVPVAAAA